MATITMAGLRFYAYHGFYAEEQKVGTNYIIDIHIDTQLNIESLKKGDIEGTINYEKVFLICQRHMQQPQKLIETLAINILEETYALSPMINQVKILLKKHHPPIIGSDLSYTAIELKIPF